MWGIDVAIGMLSKRNREVNKVVLLPVDEIRSNRSQPRKHFDSDALQELCRSIITSGLLQPVTVRRHPEGKGYELIAGERRTMAFRILGRDHIPAIVEEYNDEQSAVLALIENLQRKDLNYFEEAAGIERLMQQLSITQLQVSQRLGKAQSTIANKLRLLKFSPKIQDMLLQSGLTERHARALLKIPDEERQQRAVDHIAGNMLNVEQTERYVEKLLKEAQPIAPSRIFVVKDMRLFLNTINRAVETMKSAGIVVDTVRREDEQYFEYILKVPKTSIYRAP